MHRMHALACRLQDFPSHAHPAAVMASSATGARAQRGEAAQLPIDAWARILRFTGWAPAAATAKCVAEAAAAVLAELASERPGVADYTRGLAAPRLAEAFAAELLFGQGE